MLGFASRLSSNVIHSMDLSGRIDYLFGTNMVSLMHPPYVGNNKNEKLAEAKKCQKEEQLQACLYNYPPSTLEEEVLKMDSVEKLLLGYLEKKWTCQDVLKIFIKRAMEIHEKTNCISEVLFEEALRRAQLLDQYLIHTGTLIGKTWIDS